MLVLYETPAGYALLKTVDDSKLKKVDDIAAYFRDEESAKKTVKFKSFCKFEDTTAALDAATSLCDGSLNKDLKRFLKKSIVKKGLTDSLAVADGKLGNLIKESLGVSCAHSKSVDELYRGIRSQMSALITGLPESDVKAMTLGLSHSLSRYKLKFSPDKVDTMIIQAIALLDELDKELNTYAMRVREWYGWHFPEMSKIISDNIVYAKIIRLMGMRTKAHNTDMSAILDEDTETELKDAAEISMGTEVSDEDLSHVTSLCEQVISISEYRVSLFEYLKNRMNAIAPNLSVMVGELVGARLVAHAGSLINLAKCPASTVQILGAEKALFRALKTKHDTPKYGLIYHASLVGQSAPKYKGKISRVLAGKTSLCARVDALGEDEGVTIGFDCRTHVEKRLRILEGGNILQMSGRGKTHQQDKKYEKVNSEAYSVASDAVSMTTHSTAEKKSTKKSIKKVKKTSEVNENDDETPKKKKKSKTKSKKRVLEEVAAPVEVDDSAQEAPVSKKAKKSVKKSKKKSKTVESA